VATAKAQAKQVLDEATARATACGTAGPAGLTWVCLTHDG